MKQPVPNFLLMVVMLQFVCKIKYLGVHLWSSKKLRLSLHEPMHFIQSYCKLLLYASECFNMTHSEISQFCRA